MEAKRWHWDSPDTNYVRYILLVIILDLSMGLFVSFAAVCPTWVHISVDSTTLLNVALSNDRWTLDWKLDIRRQMGQMVQYMNQVWALLVRHHHILRLWTLYFIPSLHRETHSIHQLWGNRFGRMGMIICPNMDKKWSFLVSHMHVRLELIIFYPYFGI